jgi:hypothetical protein
MQLDAHSVQQLQALRQHVLKALGLGVVTKGLFYGTGYKLLIRCQFATR